MIRLQLASLLMLFSMNLFAQETDSTLVEEDFSMYNDAELADGAKRFCTNKVLDQSPNKLITIGYDFQSAHNLSFGVWGSLPAPSLRVKSVQGIRLNSNFPVISRNNLLLNIGVNYWETNYQIESSESHPVSSSLQTRGLRTTGVTATLFKPFNEKRFLLIQSVFDLNGDYFLPDFQSLSYTRVSPIFVYGWKKHDRLMYGFGFSRTYRVGEPNLIPVFMYNYTAPSRKWGIESVFPARANFRRTFNTRTLAFFGYELEGQTYRMSSLKGVEGIVNPELRRSELRIRMTFERSIKNFVWLSAQAGLRYPWNFNLDDGNIFRGFGDTPYTVENNLQNAFYFNLSVNLVSP
jgi:hypothetical protein